MATDNPTAAHRPAAPTAYSAVDAQPARVPARRNIETKAAFKTTELGLTPFSRHRVRRLVPSE